jgi:hypothetical protein
MNDATGRVPQQIDTNDSCIVQHSLQVHTYPVSRDRLEGLRAAMSAGSDELALGTFLLSVGITAIATLVATDIKSPTISTGFWVAAIFGPPIGALFGWKCFRSRKQGPKMIDDILQSPEEKRKPIR